MATKRREFLKMAGKAGLSIAGIGVITESGASRDTVNPQPTPPKQAMSNAPSDNSQLSIIGGYGPWAASLHASQLPALSFRRKEWSNLATWRKVAKKRVMELMAIPDIGALPQVTLKRQFNYDGLHVEELTWQLPYGRPTEAILLKPANAKGPLPAILAFHDHGGNKYFGTRKITRTSDEQHTMMQDHQATYYEGLAWANEIAKRGYVVLVSDAFSFASRRVMLQDVPQHLRNGLSDEDPERPANINAYNQWAGEHEHIMAKSLFSAGTTWPGVFFAEDRKALDILCSRKDVDSKNVGCCGLSGGGLRTVFMGGLDERIKCAVCVGFMTTWNDFVLNKSFTHTWMTYVPLLPNDLDFPEIIGLRAPLPTMVLNDRDDRLYTLDEMKNADDMLSQIYQKAKASDRYKCSFYPGGHKFDRAMQAEAFAWFDRWLK
jgi:dienelactone hydrolase